MSNSEKSSSFIYVVIILGAIAIGYLLFGSLFNETEKEPKIIKVADLSEFHHLPMYKVGNLSTVKLKVNGLEGDFIIDTGAEESVFNSEYVKSLNIKIADSIPIPNTAIILTDTIKVTCHYDSLFTFKKKFFSYNLTGLKTEIAKSDTTFKNTIFFGILGQDVMRNEGIILNFQNNNLYLTNKYKKTSQ
jgi:hypothetical protein